MKKGNIEKAMKQAKGSLEVEGFNITKTHDDLVRARLSGYITEEEFRKKVGELIIRKRK